MAEWRGTRVTWRVALRDLRAHVARYVLTFVAVTLGVAFVGGTRTLTDMLTASAEDVYEDAYGAVDAVVRPAPPPEGAGPDWFAYGPTGVPESTVARTAAVDGVARAAPLVSGWARLVDRDGRPLVPPGPVAPVALGWVEDERLNPFDVVAGGRAPERAGEVAIDKRSADLSGTGVGDRVLVTNGPATEEMTVTGLVRIGGADSPGSAQVVVLSLGQAVDLLGEEGRVTAVWVLADEGVSRPDLVAGLDATLAAPPAPPEADGEVGEGEVASAGGGGSGEVALEVVDGEAYTSDLLAGTLDDIDGYVRPVLTFALAAVAVGGLVIATSLAFVVAQRQPEMALLRALGASRRQVVGTVVAEALALGLLAAVAGYLLGILAAVGLTRLVGTDDMGIRTSLVVRPASALLALGTGVVVTLVSAAAPAWRAGSVPPMAALGEAAAVRERRPVARALAGAAMVAAALALGLAGVRGPASGRGTGAGVGVARAAPVLALAAAGVVVAAPATVRLAARLVRRPLALARGTVGRLAADNAARNPRRSALCASALAVGLIVVTYVLVLGAAEAAWRDARRAEPPLSGDGVDLVVYAPASAPPGLVEAIAARPEVGAVTGARETVVLVDDVPGLLVGVRPEAAADLWDYEVVAGSLADVTPAAEPALPGVAISARQAEEGGLTVGDEVSAVFPSVGPVRLRVAALFTGNRPVAGGGERFLADPMLVDTAVVAEHDPDGWSGEVSVGLASGVSTEEGRAAVRDTVAAADTGPLDVVVATPEERAAQLDDGASDDTLDQLESTIDALLALAVVVALVGVVNAQVLSTVERSREIGLLRAVGATRAQVRAAVRWETVVVGLLGTVLALAVGVPLALVLVEGQRPALPTVVPVRALAVVAALTLAATFVASLVPAWWSARHISPRPDDTR